MPVIVTSDFYDQPEQPNALEMMFAGFAEGVKSGIDKAQEQAYEAEKFRRAKQAELDKMREQAKLDAAAAKEARDYERPFRERGLSIQEATAKQNAERFENERKGWETDLESQKLDLEAKRQAVEQAKAIGPVQQKQAELELAATEGAFVERLLTPYAALRSDYAKAIGDGDAAKGNASLDAMEDLVHGAISRRDYKEAQRILGMAQNFAVRKQAAYHDSEAQKVVAAARNDGNVKTFPDILAELDAAANDTSLSVMQRGEIAAALRQKAQTRVVNTELRTQMITDIDAKINALKIKMDQDTDPENDAQYEAKLLEFAYLKAGLNGTSLDDPMGMFNLVTSAHEAFRRNGRDSMRNLPQFFPGSAAQNAQEYMSKEQLDAYGAKRDFLSKALEDIDSEMSSIDSLLEDMDEDDPEYVNLMAFRQELKGQRTAVSQEKLNLFKQVTPESRPQAKAAGRPGVSSSDILADATGQGAKKPAANAPAKPKTPAEMQARMKELDKIEEERGLTRKESEERDGINESLRLQNEGGAAMDMDFAKFKKVDKDFRSEFAQDKASEAGKRGISGDVLKQFRKFSLAGIENKEDAEFVRGHLKKLKADYFSGLTPQQTVAVSKAIESITEMIANNSYPGDRPPSPPSGGSPAATPGN